MDYEDPSRAEEEVMEGAFAYEFIMLLAGLNGVEAEEVVRLRWEQVDFGKTTITFDGRSRLMTALEFFGLIMLEGVADGSPFVFHAKAWV